MVGGQPCFGIVKTRCAAVRNLYRLFRCEWYEWKEEQFTRQRAHIEDHMRRYGWTEKHPDWEPMWEMSYF